MNEYRKAYVFVSNKYAGILKETDDGYSFQYDKSYLLLSDCEAVSLTIPLKNDEYKSKYLFPFFDGLIPEGWLLNVVARNWKIDLNDRFGLLLVTCSDPIGNVIIKETL